MVDVFNWLAFYTPCPMKSCNSKFLSGGWCISITIIYMWNPNSVVKERLGHILWRTVFGDNHGQDIIDAWSNENKWEDWAMAILKMGSWSTCMPRKCVWSDKALSHWRWVVGENCYEMFTKGLTANSLYLYSTKMKC